MKRVAVIGAGWLGLPLAQWLKQQGHTVYATRTTLEGSKAVQVQGLESFVCQLDQPDGLSNALLERQCDTLVGCFPPGFRQGNGEQYATHWQLLVNQAKQANIQKLVMVSSTSVYPDIAKPMNEQDASLGLALDNSAFDAKARVLLKAEQHVITSGMDYTIVRCSGLIGPKRHPSRFVSKMAQVSRLAPANMLHLYDAIGIVYFALTHLPNSIVNATTPNTVSKAEFYQAALDAVGSDASLPTVCDIEDKRILCDKLLSAGYRFHFSHTREALQGYE
ncbi:nucleoside-diphosphate-sugar epimerase [Vibrio sp. RC586]|uniref:NAD(P)H-binding protein n=1 Tax=Vibrio sp. RC586 TaxID=675815 RepID=UPI0001BB8572|nr:NAD(P)H-binding protein [Vibrio sp. RC586]EEY98283.1 nucleoside-diphosphate-sugar epimerase [Vibrio sp. RC586]